MYLSKIRKVTAITLLLGLTVNSSIHAFPRIENAEDAINKAPGCINLIGEIHHNEDDIKQKNLLKQLAETGQIILALEGSIEDHNNTFFGLEEQNTCYLAGLLEAFMKLFTHMSYKKSLDILNSSKMKSVEINDAIFELKKSYVPPVSVSKYRLDMFFSLIWDYIETVFVTKVDNEEISLCIQLFKNNKLFKIILEVDERSSIYKYLGKNSFDDNFFDNMSDKYNDWYIVISRIASYWLSQSTDSSIISSTLLREIKDAVTKCENLYTAIEDAVSFSELAAIREELDKIEDGLLEKLRVDLRNEIFLSKICSAYEKTQDLQKPFFAIVGASHIPFLKEQLAQKGYQVEVNNRSTELLEKTDL